ncbi:uncharacterized protein LOC107265878 [Cephus cinctus]|uniref:Uncharacterized protein LOC107265878 n=1 Tax=Cephus cinctus TaxID=211228 RepID=A0AAJ7FGW5_CEPCN|nr:uncharacterized protein LOC107265878 [Cephus cinctus]XP_024938911.1 uncharacterized protein LOC107265878 [Cephus cinctus]
MSTLATKALSPSVVGDFTTSLMPTVTRVDTRLEVSPVSVVLAVSIVFILSPVTVSENSIILAAFYRYKRLRTASNCLLASLAISDFGVGVFMPFGMHLELSGLPENGVSTLCIAPYCIVIALCSVSVLVTVAIAVDRLTSLAQPLRYKNIITHSSVEKYIAVFWIYAIAVGLSPLIYAQIMGITQPHSGSCRFGAAVSPPVRVFLVVAVWAPSALVLLGCYMYVYLVARAHARAIYTVELSFRHQTQTLTLPRYGQTLAVTVGAFLILWLPFQTCMLLDIFCGTNILSEWAVVWLGLPILAHSGANPWIYAFHHGEMRVAAGKIAEDLVALFGVTPSRYGCSLTRRESNTNLELAEVNNSNDGRRHPAEDCFAAKQNTLYASRRCLEMPSKHADISPERDTAQQSCSDGTQGDIVEEDIHDLTKMLDPKYIIDRNHVIDSNHNIDKIKNLKYLLDPTFNKIRHLRRLNHKRLTSKNFPKFSDPKFISYQNLKSDGTLNRKLLQLNTMSDPVLNADSPSVDTKDLTEVLCHHPVLCQRRNSNLASMSDPNIKAATGHASEINLRVFSGSRNTSGDHRYSVQNLDHNRHDHSLARHAMQCRQLENQRKLNGHVRPRVKLNSTSDYVSPALDLRLHNTSVASLPTPESVRSTPRSSPMQRTSPSSKYMTITPNKLANFCYSEPVHNVRYLEPRVDPISRLPRAKQNPFMLKHSESINTIEPMTRVRFLEPSRVPDSLTVPTIHSEPPSPMDPLPLDSLQEEDTSNGFQSINPCTDLMIEPLRPQPINRNLKSPIRHSDPIIPSVLLNIEDCSDSRVSSNDKLYNGWSNDFLSNSSPVDPEELSKALLKNSERTKLQEPIFSEHDSTRYSSRRPSDSKWSESSRSQEVLSTVTEHHRFPSSYSVNNFQNCTSGSDLNDVTCLDPFMCPDALSSSLRDSFFSAPSVPDSDIFTSFDEGDEHVFSQELEVLVSPAVHSSMSSTNLKRTQVSVRELQSKSTESVFRKQGTPVESFSIVRLEPSVHRSRPLVRPGKDYILKDPSRRNLRLAPLATPTPTEISTPTFDVVPDMANDTAMGVRV